MIKENIFTFKNCWKRFSLLLLYLKFEFVLVLLTYHITLEDCTQEQCGFFCLGWCSSVDWALAWIAGQVPPVGGTKDATTQRMFLSLFFSLPSHLNKKNLKKKKNSMDSSLMRQTTASPKRCSVLLSFMPTSVLPSTTITYGGHIKFPPQKRILISFLLILCSLSYIIGYAHACYGLSSSTGSLWYSATYRLLSMLLGIGLISVPSCSSILFRLKRSSYVIKLMAKPRWPKRPKTTNFLINIKNS